MAQKKYETFGMVKSTCPKCGTVQLMKLVTTLKDGEINYTVSCQKNGCDFSRSMNSEDFDDFLAGPGRDTQMV